MCLCLLCWLSFCSPAAQAQQCPEGALPLARALDLSHRQNPDVIAARDALKLAESGVTVAAERPNPTLSVSASQYDPFRTDTQMGVYHTPLFSAAHVDQLIERGGKRDARLKVARLGIGAADADLADAERHDDDDVKSAYFDLKLATARLEALRDIAALQHDTADAADRRLKAGDISPTDRARIELEALKAENDLRAAETEALKARIALSGLMGCAVPTALSATDDWPQSATEPGSPGLRADVAGAEARLDAAGAAVALAQAQQHRDVTVGLDYDRDPRNTPYSAATLTLSVPLFLAHRYEGEVAQAKAQRDAAASLASLAMMRAEVERRAAAENLEAAKARRDRSLLSVLPQAEKAGDAVEYAYAHGAATLLDLLDARRQLRTARLDALTAQNDFAHALADRDAALVTYQASTLAVGQADASRNTP